MAAAKESEIDLLLKYYPDDQRAGCPFNTGIKNVLSQPLSTDFRGHTNVTTRPTVQAYERYSGRCRVPRPSSILLEVQGRQAEVVGVQYVAYFAT